MDVQRTAKLVTVNTRPVNFKPDNDSSVRQEGRVALSATVTVGISIGTVLLQEETLLATND